MATTTSLLLLVATAQSASYRTISGQWTDDFVLSPANEIGWISDGSVTITSQRSYHGTFYGDEDSDDVEQFSLSQSFFCDVKSEVSVSYTIAFCGSESDDFVQLFLDDNSMAFNDLNTNNGQPFYDYDLVQSSSCNSWRYLGMGPFSIPTVDRDTLFDVRFEIGVNFDNDDAAITNIQITCDPLPTPQPTPKPTTSQLTLSPSTSPSTSAPSQSPSSSPTLRPSISPTIRPSTSPTIRPSISPTRSLSEGENPETTSTLTTADISPQNDDSNSPQNSESAAPAFLWGIIGFVAVSCVLCVSAMLCVSCRKRREGLQLRRAMSNSTASNVEMGGNGAGGAATSLKQPRRNSLNAIKISPFRSSPNKRVQNPSLQQNIMSSSFSLNAAVCDVGDGDGRETANIAHDGVGGDNYAEESVSVADLEVAMAAPGSVMSGGEAFADNLENDGIATDAMMEDIIGHMSTPGGDGRDTHVLSYDEGMDV